MGHTGGWAGGGGGEERTGERGVELAGTNARMHECTNARTHARTSHAHTIIIQYQYKQLYI